MRKFYLLTLQLLIAVTLFSQTTATVGTASGTADILGPTTSTTSGARTERQTAIYTAAELTAAGMAAGNTIFSIAWNKTGPGSYTGTNLTVRVWLKASSATTFASNPSFATETGAATLVYETSAGSIPAATGPVRFIFTNSTFVWNGTDHIQVITEFVRPASWTNTDFNWTTLASVTNSAANSNGATGIDALTRSGTRPQVIFEIAAPGNDAALTGMPNPVPAGPGGQAVDVILRNTGNTVLNTADINWTVNGAPQTAFAWNGSLLPGESTIVSIGSFLFANGLNTVTATVSNPNGAADLNSDNNVVSKTIAVCTPLNGTYTIDKAFPTAGTNFNSFTDLSDFLASCGVLGDVTVDVVPNSGPYNEQVNFRNIVGLGGGGSLTINGNGNTITATTTATDRYIIRLSDLSFVTINNLVVAQGAFTTGWMGIHLFNSGNNITINDVDINMSASTSVLVGGIIASGDATSFTTGGVFSNIQYTGNTITGGGKGINIYGTSASPVTNLVIAGNTVNQTGSDGIFVSYTNGAHINNNTVNFTTGDGIEVYQNTSNTEVYANTISATNPTTTGNIRGIFVNASSVSGARVFNNLIWKMTTPGANVYGLVNGSNGGQFYFNTVILDDATATGATTAGFFEDATNTGAIVKNNIFYLTRPSSAWSAMISLSSSSTVTTAVTSNHNVFYTTSAALANRRQITSTNPPANVYASLSDWRTASGEDINSFETDPFFQANTAIPTSGIINNQADPGTGVTNDITGALRSAVPDPGVYEFISPGIDAAITGFVVPARPFCNTSLPVEFSLTNGGSDPLTTAVINWTVNGVAQVAINWTGNLAPSASVTVPLGTVTVTGNTAYDFTATVSSPNGGTDANPANNSFTYAGFRRGLNGAYTLNGTQPASSTNYQSFSRLSEDLSFYGLCEAVTVTVAGGPYTEQVVFNAVPGSSATNTVTINGNGQVLQFNPTVASADHILQLNGVNHMVVENLVINSTHATQGRGIFITNGSSNLTIRNNTINVAVTNTTSSSFGIIAGGPSWLLDGTLSENLTITGNTVVGGYTGIQLDGVNFNAVGNKLRNSVVSGNIIRDFYNYGIYLNYTDNVTVEKNRVSRPSRTNSASSAIGLNVGSGSTAFLLNKNTVGDLYNSGMATAERAKGAQGISINGATAISTGRVQNNLVYGSSNTSTQYAIQDAASGTGNEIKIYHNTFVLNNQATTGSATTSVIYLSGSSSGGTHDIQNNVVYLSRSGTGTKRLIDVSSANTNFTSNYNVFHFGTATGTIQLGRIGSNNYSDLGTWQGTGKDAGSVYADPSFADPVTGNYRPMNTAVDGSAMGTISVGVPDDILDAVRSATPDPGAYESATPAPVTLQTFSGQRKENRNELRWTTASESSNKGFYVERSVDGATYSTLGFVPSGAAGGNSSTELSYTYADGAFTGNQHYYRLRQEDLDGRLRYSKVVLIRSSDVAGSGLTLTSLYPNPVSTGSLTLSVLAPKRATVLLRVSDAAGRIVMEQRRPVGEGSNTLLLPVAGLAKGTYFVQLPEGEGKPLAFIKE